MYLTILPQLHLPLILLYIHRYFVKMIFIFIFNENFQNIADAKKCVEYSKVNFSESLIFFLVLSMSYLFILFDISLL